MKEPETETIEIHGAIDDWLRVELPDGTRRFVANAKIAGLDIGIKHSGCIFVEAEEYGIEDKYRPVLLVEAASWYSASADSEE